MGHRFDDRSRTGDRISSCKDSFQTGLKRNGIDLNRSLSSPLQSFKDVKSLILRQPFATTDKDGIKRLRKGFRGDILSHFGVETDLNSHFVDDGEIFFDHLPRQTIGWETMGEKTAQFISGFKKSDSDNPFFSDRRQRSIRMDLHR